LILLRLRRPELQPVEAVVAIELGRSSRKLVAEIEGKL
jgi:hypothetical protein